MSWLEHAQRILSWDGRAVWIAAAATVVVVLAVWRRGASRRSGRVELALLPSPEFEVSLEDVVRFAAQLGRVRKASGLRHTSESNSVRLRFRSVAGGRLLASIEVAEGFAPALRRSMFVDVESRPIDWVDARFGPSVADGNGRSVPLPAGRIPSESLDPHSADLDDHSRPDDDPERGERRRRDGTRRGEEHAPLPRGSEPSTRDAPASLWVDLSGDGFGDSP